MSRQRVVFLDNLRLTAAPAIVTLHFTCSYSTVGPFWPFHDTHPSRAFDLLIVVLCLLL